MHGPGLTSYTRKLLRMCIVTAQSHSGLSVCPLQSLLPFFCRLDLSVKRRQFVREVLEVGSTASFSFSHAKRYSPLINFLLKFNDVRSISLI